MVKRITYIDFISDHAFLDKYNNYQQRYAETIRESDRIILSIIDASLRGLRQSDTSCLDIGCSTGNLLLHIKNAFPSLKLMGGDLAQSSIDLCHANAALSSIRFATLNILNLPREEKFDIVVVNAVLYMLSDEECQLAFHNISSVLAPNGIVIAFDFFHPFEQDVTILEKSQLHPDGLELHFRPMRQVEEMLRTARLMLPVFRPFTLPIDLPRPADPGDITSYTIPTADGSRLPFRGTLFQPWCHMIANESQSRADRSS